MQLESEVIQVDGGIVVVVFRGRLIAGPRLTLEESQIRSLIKQGANRLVLDLEHVEHADSSGFCLILHAYTALRGQGGQLRVAGPSKRLMDLFQLTETEKLLSILPDRESAIQSLKRKVQSKADVSAKPQAAHH